MCQERSAETVVPAVNPYDGQSFPAHPASFADTRGRPRTLEWMGPQAFKARYGAQPGSDADFGMWWGPRHDQHISHHRATPESPTGLLYAYDLTWDEYAVIATDLPAIAVEAVLCRARANDRHMSAEVFAELLANHLTAPPPRVETTTEVAAEVEL